MTNGDALTNVGTNANNVGVIFDCDGTLVDSMSAWRELEASLGRRAQVELTREDTDLLTTLTIPECGVFFHERCGLGETPQDVVRMIDEFMADYYAHRVCARPGALAFVQALHEQGVPMAVASSTPAELLHLGLDHVGIAPYLKAIVSVDDAGASKREPAVYDLARASLGTERAQTWGFEDALYAVRTLKAAGYRAFGVYDCDESGAYADLTAEADQVIRSFTEIAAEKFLAFS